MNGEREYHSARARAERELAYRSADERGSDAHMRLSALHLSRALILSEVNRRMMEGRQVPLELGY
jgi:hypothetical protein